MEQERAAKEREREEEARRKRREEAARVKRMLEAAFDGDNDEINKLLQEVLVQVKVICISIVTARFVTAYCNSLNADMHSMLKHIKYISSFR